MIRKPGILNFDDDITQHANGSNSNLRSDRCNNRIIEHSSRNMENKSSNSRNSRNNTTITRRHKGKIKMIWNPGINNFNADIIQYANGGVSNLPTELDHTPSGNNGDGGIDQETTKGDVQNTKYKRLYSCDKHVFCSVPQIRQENSQECFFWLPDKVFYSCSLLVENPRYHLHSQPCLIVILLWALRPTRSTANQSLAPTIHLRITLNLDWLLSHLWSIFFLGPLDHHCLNSHALQEFLFKQTKSVFSNLFDERQGCKHLTIVSYPLGVDITSVILLKYSMEDCNLVEGWITPFALSNIFLDCSTSSRNTTLQQVETFAILT